MIRFNSNLVFLVLSTLLLASCEGQNDNTHKTYSKEELIEANRNMVQNEAAVIDRYIELKELETRKTETGIHFQILEEGNDSASVSSGDLVQISFRSFLLDSTEIAFSPPDQPFQFKVDQDDVVSGLHEGVKLLSKGDSARFIIPSYLAYGLTGTEKVPPKATLVYEVRLLSIY